MGDPIVYNNKIVTPVHEVKIEIDGEKITTQTKDILVWPNGKKIIIYQNTNIATKKSDVTIINFLTGDVT